MLRTFLAASILLALSTGLVVRGEAHAQSDAPRVNAVRADLGLALSLRKRDDRDLVGFAYGFDYERRLHRYVGVGVRVSGAIFPYDADLYAGDGRSSFLGVGPMARLHLLPDAGFGDLYVAAAPELVFTGSLVRLGLDGRVGLDLTLPRDLSIGPFVGYTHVLQAPSASQGPADGRILSFGVSLAMRFGERLGEDDADDDEVSVEPEPDPITVPIAELEPDPITVPEPVVVDTDSDGVQDDRDLCPSEPASTDDGCPPPPPADLDGDGILDPDDACPAIAGVESTGGCPLVPPPADSDRDGFTDGDDRCPDVPAASSIDGCPLPAVRALDVTLRFHTGSTTPTSESIPELRRALSRLRADPSIRISIEGHADHLGEQSRNGQLSIARAGYVHTWLVQHGISPDRLEMRGAGSHTPLVQGANPGDLAPNRRVELHIID